MDKAHILPSHLRYLPGNKMFMCEYCKKIVSGPIVTGSHLFIPTQKFVICPICAKGSVIEIDDESDKN